MTGFVMLMLMIGTIIFASACADAGYATGALYWRRRARKAERALRWPVQKRDERGRFVPRATEADS